MTDWLQLGGIHIERFRRLGAPCDFAFAPGPGVTILVGPNGSGKSTVLDAIEWTLTEAASRLPLPSAASPRAPSIFRTLGAEEDPVVVLSFNTASGEGHRLTSGEGEERVAGLLRRRESPWSEIKSVAAALRWTHFSSQRSTAKLGYEEGDAILKAFAAPAGLERLKGIDRRLWGRDTQAAFKDRERNASEKVIQHRTALERLRHLELPRPNDAGIAIARRLVEVRALLLQEPDLPFEPEVSDLALLEEGLSAFRTAVEARLGELRSLASLLRDGNNRLARQSIEKDEAEQSLRTAEQIAARRSEALELVIAEREVRQSNSDRLLSARADLMRNLSAKAELSELEVTRRSLQLRLAEARLQRGSVEANISRIERLDGFSGRLRAAIALRETEDSLQRLTRFGDPEVVQTAANKQMADLIARRDDLARQREQLQATLSQENERLQSMAALTAAIAGHLHDEDTVCPVCSAVYPARELVVRARAAAIAPGPAAQQVTRLFGETTQELGRVSGQLRLAASRRDEARVVSANGARLRAERERLMGIVGPGPWTMDAVEELDAQLIELRGELNVTDETDLRLRRADLEEHRARLAPLMEDLEQQAAGVDQAVEAVVARALSDRSEADLRAELRAIELQLDRAAAQLGTAAAEHGHAIQLAEGSRDNARRLREVHAVAARSFEEETARVDRARRSHADLLGGLTEDDFIRANEEQSARIRRLLERVATMRDESAAFQSATDSEADDELTLLRVTYLPSTDRATIPELREAITQQLRRADVDMRALQVLKKRLSQRARVRRDVDQRLQGTALRPWNELFRSVYASLAGSLGETLEWTADRVDMRYNEIESRVRPSVSGEPIPGWLAGHYFSEGQLAALQISAMITASVLLPWSRWRALLLDDPLQHADVIKVGAFADLIRALCTDLKHQIIMTTHDRSQADFIAAKFRAGNLSAKIIQFERPVPSHQKML